MLAYFSRRTLRLNTYIQIKLIIQLLRSHRDDPDSITDEVLRDATVVAESIGLVEDMPSLPRIFGKQCNRKNQNQAWL